MRVNRRGMEYYRDKAVIVTGGGSGIGRALCLELGRRGAHVVAADISREGAEGTARAVAAAGGRARAAHLDVTREGDVRRLIEETAADHGKLDLMFNVAGIGVCGEARDMDLDHWHRILDVNLTGVIYGSVAAYRQMIAQGSGHLVNMSSIYGLFPGPLESAYSASKFGVMGLSSCLRLEGAGLGVKVSVVCPGYVRTELLELSPVLKAPREDVLALLPPRMIADVTRTARAILAGVARNRAIIVFPFTYRLLWWLYRLSPTLFERLSYRLIREFRALRRES